MPAPRIEDIADSYEAINRTLEVARGQYAQLESYLVKYGKEVMESKGVKGGETYRAIEKDFRKQREAIGILEQAQGKYAELLRKFTKPMVGIKGEVERYKLNKARRNIINNETSSLVRVLRAPAVISFFLGIFLLAFSQANLTGFAIGNRFVEVTTTFILGFIFLILGAVLLLIVLSKHRHMLAKAENISLKASKPVKKQAKKKKKSRK